MRISSANHRRRFLREGAPPFLDGLLRPTKDGPISIAPIVPIPTPSPIAIPITPAVAPIVMQPDPAEEAEEA
jgi:hypothetical protein